MINSGVRNLRGNNTNRNGRGNFGRLSISGKDDEDATMCGSIAESICLQAVEEKRKSEIGRCLETDCITSASVWGHYSL